MNKHAYVFPGQGAQYKGMGKNLYEAYATAKEMFEIANDIAGFRLSDIMFEGTEEDLKQTKVTQPAIFVHSVIAFRVLATHKPNMVAGHSLGEFSALVANNVLSFEEALQLVCIRANAMQKACEAIPSTMAAVLGLDDETVERICAETQQKTGEIVVAANYNCPGQLVISGTIKGVEEACNKLKFAGAKRALLLPVGGAFHSPIMEPAKEELASAIKAAAFKQPDCPIYQNITAQPVTEPETIKTNLMNQLTGPVLWTQTVKAMIADGANTFTESGPGKVLQGLILKVDSSVSVNSIS
jgi:[acyl-carrier-protein] S-malonyltransferase